MKKILFTALFAITCFYTNAQVQILVDNNGTEAVFDNITDALTNAQSGAKIYLPKGVFNLPSIDKEIHVYGVGYRDGTQISYCYLNNGSNNSSFSGIEFISSSIQIGQLANNDVQNISFKRCKFNADMYTARTSSSYSRNITFSECILNSVRNNGTSEYNIFQKCIFEQYVENSNSLFKNCIFYQLICGFGYSQNSYENCIFLSETNPLYGSYHTFNQNLFLFNVTNFGTHTSTNNIVNTPITDIFENHDGSGFSFDHDYTLKATCPGKNAGTDGTDMGIYGTEVNGSPTPALKFGSIGNPQIYESEIASEVDAEGKLNMTIRVKAQEY